MWVFYRAIIRPKKKVFVSDYPTDSRKTQRVQTFYCDFLPKEATYLILNSPNHEFDRRFAILFFAGDIPGTLIWIFLVENPGFPLNKRGFDPVIHPGIADDGSHKKAIW